MTIKKLFQIAFDEKASDIHLTVGMPPVIRVEGELGYIEGGEEVTPKHMEEMVYSVLDDQQKKRFLEEKGLDFGYSMPTFRLRVNAFMERGNIGMVARVIAETMPTMEEIEMSPVLFDLLNLKQGLILMTGPTGCGKSTALAAMVNHINKNRFENIITLEDPIEYLFTPEKSVIAQRQLGRDMVSFESGLKHALRQDPNVIMVGEMRDLETIASTITLAETGHLVLATLHTYSAAQTIDRIIDIFPPHQQNQIRMQLSTILAGVVSQRLVATKSSGRVAAREVLINTPACANLIRENKISQIKTVIETGSKDGMISLDRDLANLYGKGVITAEVARSYMNNPELLGKIK